MCTITDHALVRYMERVLQIDLDRIRADIAAKVSQAASLGASSVTVEGFVYRIARNEKGVAVATLHPEHSTGKIPPPKSKQTPHSTKRADDWRRRKFK